MTARLGVPLGPATSGLNVVTQVHLEPVPTGIYHLLDPEHDPLVSVTVSNESFNPHRICVTAYFEGISGAREPNLRARKVRSEG